MTEIMEKKCPNCAGRMEHSLNKCICPYCGTEMEIETYAEVSDDDDCFPEENVPRVIVNIDNASLTKIEKTWDVIKKTFEADLGFEDYMELFEKIAKTNTGSATNTANPELYKKAYDRISAHLNVGEEMLFWLDYGIFAQNAKQGMAITNKRLLFFKKKDIKQCSYKEIKTIEINVFGSAHINGDEDYWITSIGCSESQLGIIMTYIFEVSGEMNGRNHKINIRYAG